MNSAEERSNKPTKTLELLPLKTWLLAFYPYFIKIHTFLLTTGNQHGYRKSLIARPPWWPHVAEANLANNLTTKNVFRRKPSTTNQGEEDKLSTTSSTSESTPFGANIEEKRLADHVKILANPQWTLIFNHPGRYHQAKPSICEQEEKTAYPNLLAASR